MMFENHRAAFERLMITGFLSKRTFKLFLTFLPKDTKYKMIKLLFYLAPASLARYLILSAHL